MDRFTEMEMFVRVVEAGGFTEAARRAGVSKSAVSKQISALEQRLGARLLNRTTRRVNPTEIGLAYYDRASRVLAEAAEADAVAATLQGAPRGDLRISAPHSFGLHRISSVVADFAVAHSEVKVHMSLDDQFVELISEGFDLAIRIGTLEDSSLKARKIGETHLALIASPKYLEERGEPLSIDDLVQHDLLHYSYLASGRTWRLFAPSGQERQVRAGGPLTVNNGDALLQGVEAGLGIALLPDFIYQDRLRAGAVNVVLPGATGQPLGIWAVTPPGRYTQPKVRVFVDFLAERLKADGSREKVQTLAAE
ncbi:MAG: LysR family transcriptional regulator [Pseudomonadota bacterium]